MNSSKHADQIRLVHWNTKGSFLIVCMCKNLSPFETCKEEGDYGISILARVPIQNPINFDLHYKDIE